MSSAREATVQADGVEIVYDVRGSGPTILLVMGLGGQMIAWRDEFCDSLAAQGFQVVRFDNRDVGLSTMVDATPPSANSLLVKRLTGRRPSAPYLLSDMAADGIAVLDDLSVEKAHVVGVSMGGMIAQTMAIEYPDRVASLCSIMSTTGNPRVGNAAPSVLGKLRKAQSRSDNPVQDSVDFFTVIAGPHFDPEEHALLAEAAMARSSDPRGVARQMAAIMASPDRTRALRKLDLPTVVIHGLLDRLVRPSGGIATAKAIPNSRLLMFNDMGHDIPKPRSPEVIDAIVTNARRVAVSTPV